MLSFPRHQGENALVLFVIQRPKAAQPSPLGRILGGWGQATNKPFCRGTGYGVSAKISKLTEVCIACYNEFDLKTVGEYPSVQRLRPKLQ